MKHFLYLTLIAIITAPLTGLDFMGSLMLAGGIGVIGGALSTQFVGTALAIPVIQATGLFTNSLIAKYSDFVPVKQFLGSFFPSNFSRTKYISIQVRRGVKLMATDVLRYSDGNRNTFSKASEKTFYPPFYHEWISMSDHDLYDNMIIALSNGNTDLAQNLRNEMAADLNELQRKIERSVEYQAAQVLQLGTITLDDGTVIDFKRKATSIVSYSAGIDFSIGTVDPSEVIKTGCTFIRNIGKSQSSTFNCILGSTALMQLKNNTIIKATSDIKFYKLNEIVAPQMSSNGASYHGTLSCGEFIVNLWTYPEAYETSPGTSVDYINAKKIIVLPQETIGSTEFALVPQLPRDNGTIAQTGEFFIHDEIDNARQSQKMHIKAAPIVVPIAIDKIWTATVLN